MEAGGRSDAAVRSTRGVRCHSPDRRPASGTAGAGSVHPCATSLGLDVRRGDRPKHLRAVGHALTVRRAFQVRLERLPGGRGVPAAGYPCPRSPTCKPRTFRARWPPWSSLPPTRPADHPRRPYCARAMRRDRVVNRLRPYLDPIDMWFVLVNMVGYAAFVTWADLDRARDQGREDRGRLEGWGARRWF